jgi:hypothetical protein
MVELFVLFVVCCGLMALFVFILVACAGKVFTKVKVLDSQSEARN